MRRNPGGDELGGPSRARALGGARDGRLRLSAAARLATLGLGALAAALAALALLGQFGAWAHDLDALSSVRPQASVALGLVALGLLALRRATWLALPALGLAAYGLISLGPAWDRFEQASAACAPVPLRVAIANIEAVGATTAHFAAVEANLRAARADVVALVEASPRFYDAATALRADLPHSVGKRGAHGAVILSRHPLTELTVRPWPDDAPIHELARFELGEAEIGIAALHLSRPIIGPQEAEVAQLGALLSALPPNRILLGDFNAAPWSHAVAEIERDGGVRMTPGFRRTWRGLYPNPFFNWRIPAIYGAQIDLVLASEAFGVRSSSVFEIPGSVHWGVVAELEAPTVATGAPGCPA